MEMIASAFWILLVLPVVVVVGAMEREGKGTICRRGQGMFGQSNEKIVRANSSLMKAFCLQQK